MIIQNRSPALALMSRLPSVYDNRASVDAGGLMSYGADVADRYRRVAYFCGQNLKKPSLLIFRSSSRPSLSWLII